jgi:hypothetical protein
MFHDLPTLKMLAGDETTGLGTDGLLYKHEGILLD